jgi:hypothetical protein
MMQPTHSYSFSLQRMQIHAISGLSKPEVNEGKDIIEISSGDESESSEHKVTLARKVDENPTVSSSKKRSLSNAATGPPNKRKAITKVVEILDSDDEHSEATGIKFSTSNPNQHIKVEQLEGHSHWQEKVAPSSDKFDRLGAAQDKDGRFILTQKVKVDFLEKLTEVPARWPIPAEETNTAYVINLNDDKKWRELDMNSKKKLDRFVKQEVSPLLLSCCRGNLNHLQDQDSWGQGTNGTTTRPTPIRFLDDLPSRRSVHQCNGARCCEMFDKKALHGYIREDPYDMTVIQEIFAAEQKQNERDGATVVAMSEM